jgi:hypothetical protein
MAALSANRPTDKSGDKTLQQRVQIPIADNVHIYQGAQVQINAAGYATPAGTATQADSHTFLALGRAFEEYDNTVTGHAQGALTCEIEQGCFLWDILASDPVAQANVGATVYAEDDHTIRATSNGTTRASAGRLLALVSVSEYSPALQALVQTVVGVP